MRILVIALCMCAITEGRTVVLLCYPSDEIMQTSCANFENQMKSCENKVIRMDDASSAVVHDRLSGIDSSVPVFIVSHGLSIEKNHFLNSKMGDRKLSALGTLDPQKLPLGIKPLTDSLEGDDSTAFETIPILRAAEKHPKVLSSCFGGRACVEGKIDKLIASCSFDETTQYVPIGPKLNQEPVLYWLGQLYCDEPLFDTVDRLTKRDGVLSKVELQMFLAKKMGGQKNIASVFWPAAPTMEKNAVRAALGTAGFTESKVVVISNSKERKQSAETSAKNLKLPGLRTRVELLGEMMAVKSSNGPEIVLAGYYTGKSAAGDVAKKMGLIGTVKSLGEVYAVEVENLKLPCSYDTLGLPQTPVVDTKIQKPGNH